MSKPKQSRVVKWATKAGVATRARLLGVGLGTGGAPRGISAMLRVRNEAPFLRAAVMSIFDAVDEVVLVDNLSTDATPGILASLRDEFPQKVTCWQYPHEVRKAGYETWQLAEAPGTASSPNLSSTFYNWCLRKCTQPYVLKWDGDMVALDAFGLALEAWRRSDKLIMVFNGVNVHPDRQHLIAARVAEREPLLVRLRVPGLPRWVTSLTRDYPEPRLFPKRCAKYTAEMLFTQRLSSPFYHRALGDRYVLTIPEACFLHMKFCKPDPLSNYSEDLKNVIASNIAVGAELAPEWKDAMDRWQLSSPRLQARTMIPV